jgi:predicted nuclease of restriction endonuclease-like RecB superfamily
VAPRELGDSEPSIDQRLARDFARLAPSWELGLDPGPIDTEGLLLFPDFELTHRTEPSRRWLLEVVGFWTPSSLRAKLARLEGARLEHVLLLVDASKACAEGDLPASDRIVSHRRRIDARAVLERVGE